MSSFPIKEKKKKHIFSSQIRFTNANLLNYSIQLSVTEVDFFVFYFSKSTLMYFQNKRNNQLPINKKTNRIFAE